MVGVMQELRQFQKSWQDMFLLQKGSQLEHCVLLLQSELVSCLIFLLLWTRWIYHSDYFCNDWGHLGICVYVENIRIKNLELSY